MKVYLKKNLPRVTIYFVLVLLVANIVTFIIPESCNILALTPSNLYEPINYYRLITYPLVGVGLIYWLLNALPLIIFGYMFEHRLKTYDTILLIVVSCIIGGFAYIIFNQFSNDGCLLAGPVMIVRAYWAVTIITGIKFWKKLVEVEKIILVIAFLGTIGLWVHNFGFLIGQIIIGLLGILFAIIRIKR